MVSGWPTERNGAIPQRDILGGRASTRGSTKACTAEAPRLMERRRHRIHRRRRASRTDVDVASRVRSARLIPTGCVAVHSRGARVVVAVARRQQTNSDRAANRRGVRCSTWLLPRHERPDVAPLVVGHRVDIRDTAAAALVDLRATRG